MKDLEKTNSKKFLLLGIMPRRKSATKGIKAVESFRPMRSCIKKPSLKPRMLAAQLVDSCTK